MRSHKERRIFRELSELTLTDHQHASKPKADTRISYPIPQGQDRNTKKTKGDFACLNKRIVFCCILRIQILFGNVMLDIRYIEIGKYCL